MKRYVPFLVAVLLLFGIGVFVFMRGKQSMPERPRVRIGTASFSVEVADTGEKWEQGLGARDALCDSCGMFFIFDHPDTYGFWMKGMRFPLDILWIKSGKIVHIERNVDFHDQQRVYQPGASADRVLEVNAGTCEKLGIRAGDEVLFEREKFFFRL
jgi:uncharacterized membrane protein (UPF0127 family)